MILNFLMPVTEERTFLSVQMIFGPSQDIRELRVESREGRDVLIV